MIGFWLRLSVEHAPMGAFAGCSRLTRRISFADDGTLDARRESRQEVRSKQTIVASWLSCHKQGYVATPGPTSAMSPLMADLPKKMTAVPLDSSLIFEIAVVRAYVVGIVESSTEEHSVNSTAASASKVRTFRSQASNEYGPIACTVISPAG